jgi:hypothetical protein
MPFVYYMDDLHHICPVDGHPRQSRLLPCPICKADVPWLDLMRELWLNIQIACAVAYYAEELARVYSIIGVPNPDR